MAGGAIVLLVLSWVLTTSLTFLLVIVDERRMTADQLERAWPRSSRDAAIVAFGVLALVVHFIKTRGHLRSARGMLGFPLGLLLGAVAVVVVAFVGGLALEALAWVLGLPTD